ncbi:MAG: ABC transporter permease [Chloroflexota bacterium]|nr:MAG: ABC transporter permease [Chloroflexota bacterium]
MNTTYPSNNRLLEFAFRAYAVLAYVFLYLPILIVVLFAFNDSKSVQAWAGFTTNWFATAWQDTSIQSGLRNSLIVASLNMILAVTLGTLLAIGLRKSPRLLVGIFIAVMYMTIISPEIVTGLSSLLFFVQIQKTLGIPNILGIFTIVATHAVWTSALVALIVRARMAGLDDSLDEASADLGATPWTTFWSVTIPLLLPAIIAGGLLAFTFSFDDYVITQFVSGPQSSTLPIRIWGMVRFGVSPIVNAVATVILVFTLTSVFLAQYILTNEHASPRPLLVWFAFVVGLALYGIGPAQNFWNGLTGLGGVFGGTTWIIVWMGGLVALYFIVDRFRRPASSTQLNPTA